MTKLLSISADAKTVKGQKKGYLTAVLYLAPVKESGVMNVCPSATPGCSSSCLYTSGRSGIPRKDGSFPIQESRIAKTQYLFKNRLEFMAQLDKEIENFIKLANKKDLIPAVRLNGTSDLPFESAAFTGGIMQKYNDLIFYDYTKVSKRAIAWAKGELTPNYHLTFSWAETKKNQDEAKIVAAAGGNIAVVFRTPNFPDTFLDLPVINGDENDLRFLDGKGKIVGLKSKGKARKDTSGFFVDN
jgi:hypothetical protein